MIIEKSTNATTTMWKGTQREKFLSHRLNSYCSSFHDIKNAAISTYTASHLHTAPSTSQCLTETMLHDCVLHCSECIIPGGDYSCHPMPFSLQASTHRGIQRILHVCLHNLTPSCGVLASKRRPLRVRFPPHVTPIICLCGSNLFVEGKFVFKKRSGPAVAALYALFPRGL